VSAKAGEVAATMREAIRHRSRAGWSAKIGMRGPGPIADEALLRLPQQCQALLRGPISFR